MMHLDVTLVVGASFAIEDDLGTHSTLHERITIFAIDIGAEFEQGARSERNVAARPVDRQPPFGRKHGHQFIRIIRT